MAKVNYNSETREQVIKLVLKGEKSANQIAKELGIGPNTVGRWVNEYRKEHNLPSYREERRIRKVSVEELAAKNRELEKLLKKREKELADEKETVEILKNPCTSLTPLASAAALGHRKMQAFFCDTHLHAFMRPHD